MRIALQIAMWWCIAAVVMLVLYNLAKVIVRKRHE